MAFNRQLIDYLPQYLQDYRELKEITKTEQVEVDVLWDNHNQTLDNLFVQYADETGIKRWEKSLGITAKDTDTLEERRFRLTNKLNQGLPYTLTKLKENLSILYGDNFNVVVSPGIYHIEIQLGLGNINNFDEVVETLKKMIPANMTQHVQIMYNTHKTLSKFRHSELATRTHENLRKEVFE